MAGLGHLHREMKGRADHTERPERKDCSEETQGRGAGKEGGLRGRLSRIPGPGRERGHLLPPSKGG